MCAASYMSEYQECRKEGLRAVRQAQAEGAYPYLPALDEILGPQVNALAQRSLGIREIPLDMVVGTRTKGRQYSFACNFMPILEYGTEFASKWTAVYGYQMDVGISDPIKCYEYMKKFYVQEGNKRVSVLKALKMPSVDAEVIRIMPEKTDDRDVQLYYEFLDFYKVCPVYVVDFSRPGGYRKFINLLGLSEEILLFRENIRVIVKNRDRKDLREPLQADRAAGRAAGMKKEARGILPRAKLLHDSLHFPVVVPVRHLSFAFSSAFSSAFCPSSSGSL